MQDIDKEDTEDMVHKNQTDMNTEKQTTTCCNDHQIAEVRLETSIKKMNGAVSFWKRLSAGLAVALIFSLTFNLWGKVFTLGNLNEVTSTITFKSNIALASEVIPEAGVELPITWGKLGIQMVEAGVIDADKFATLYESRGGMQEDTKVMLYKDTNSSIRMTKENAQEILNLLWAFGLGNKSPILEKGLITTYDGKTPATREEALAKAGRMAATGGWPLSVGQPMNHYSNHTFVELTDAQWQLVEKVASHIYRPCCNNPSHFPDCNHGMAMLGLIELMVANGVSEDEMYQVALLVNSYWFPDTYLTIAKYLESKQTAWKDVDAQSILGAAYSSGSGFGKIQAAVEPVPASGGGGCGA